MFTLVRCRCTGLFCIGCSNECILSLLCIISFYCLTCHPASYINWNLFWSFSGSSSSHWTRKRSLGQSAMSWFFRLKTCIRKSPASATCSARSTHTLRRMHTYTKIPFILFYLNFLKVQIIPSYLFKLYNGPTYILQSMFSFRLQSGLEC